MDKGGREVPRPHTGSRQMKRLTPAESQRSSDTRQVLYDEQHNQNDNVAGPQSVAAAATEQHKNAKEHAVDHRIHIRTNHHRNDRHYEAYLHRKPIMMHGHTAKIQ